MAQFDSLEFESFGPYRFIGKSVYARTGGENSGDIFGSLWASSARIFAALDALSEYATQETNNVALLTSDKYDNVKQLLGYTVGRFMKADTPVPKGLDFFDIPEIIVAKGWVSGKFDDMISSAEPLTVAAIKQQTRYVATWEVCAEVYTKETVPDDSVSSVLGYYIGCKEKE